MHEYQEEKDMPNKKTKEKKNLVTMMDDAIAGLNLKKERLKSLLNRTMNRTENGDTDPGIEEEVTKMKTELTQMDSQLELFTQTRDEYAVQLAAAETEEKKKRIENIVKGAILIGAMNESIRVRKRAEAIARISDEEFMTKAIHKAEKLMETNKYYFISVNDVVDIMNNPKFQFCAENNPHQIELEEQENRDAWDLIVIRTLNHYGVEISPDPEVNEAEFKKVMKRTNGLEYIVNQAQQKNGTLKPIIESIKGHENKKNLEEIMEEVKELAVLTRKIQDDYAENDQNYMHGNGMTEEIVSREKALVSRVQEHIDEYMAGYNSGQKSAEDMDFYAFCLQVLGSLETQVKRDEQMLRNNAVRRQSEAWGLYNALAGEGGRRQVLQLPEEVGLLEKANAKVDRLRKYGERRGGLSKQTADYAAEAAVEIISRVYEKKNPTAEDKEFVIQQMAKIVFHQVVENEWLSNSTREQYHYKSITGRNPKSLDEATKELCESEVFRDQIDKYLRGGSLEKMALRFLGENMDKKISAKIPDTPLKKKETRIIRHPDNARSRLGTIV